jgi:hypothetical protein
MKKLSIGIILLVFLAGMGCFGSQTWVVGQKPQLTSTDRTDIAEATKISKKVITAWVDKDYDQLWKLRSPKCKVKDHATFNRMVSNWRTKIFPGAHLVKPSSAKEMISSMTIARGVSDKTAQTLLMLVTVDKNVSNKLRFQLWPDRVLFMKVKFMNQMSYLILIKDNNRWYSTCDPAEMSAGIVGM